MIKKNDVLIYETCLGKGDEYALMLAREDELTPSKLPMVSVLDLNTNLPLSPENFYEAKYFKIVGHAEDGATRERLVKKYLPEDRWLFTDELFKRSFKVKTQK